jgi:hypothetical protein
MKMGGRGAKKVNLENWENLEKGGGVAGFLASKSAGVAGLMLGATETAKADQPKKGKGKVEYPGGKIDFKSEK